MGKYYVYELVVVPDGNVCYVGKGKGKRMYVHRNNLTYRRYSSMGLYRRLRELIAGGKNFQPRKVFESDDEQEVLREEARRIALYGFDRLFNSTTVQGRTERDVTDALRQALAKGQRDKAERNRKLYGSGLPPEQRAHMSAAHQKRLADPAVRAKVSADMTARLKRAYAEGRMHNDGSAWRKLNKSRIGIPFSAERRAKLSAVRKGKPQGPHIFRAKSKHRVGKTGWIGVSVRSGNFGTPFGFVARVTDPVNRRFIELGRYPKAEDAAVAYDDAFGQLHGVRPNGTEGPRQSFLVLHGLVEQHPGQYLSYA
jgi:hypothetical protein